MLSVSTPKPWVWGGDEGVPTGFPVLHSETVIPKWELWGAGQGPFPAGMRYWRTSPPSSRAQQEFFAGKQGWMGSWLLPGQYQIQLRCFYCLGAGKQQVSSECYLGKDVSSWLEVTKTKLRNAREMNSFTDLTKPLLLKGGGRKTS